MGKSARCRNCSSGCLKLFSFLLFALSVTLIVASMVLFKPVDDKIKSGKLQSEFHYEGNIIAKKMCRLAGVCGLFMSVFALLTATKKVPYFAVPFFIGAVGMAGTFGAVVATTMSQESAEYYKKETCNVLTDGGHIGNQPGFFVAKTMNVNFMDRFMCSDVCPCPAGHQGMWNESFSEEQLNNRHRTWLNVGEKGRVPMNFRGADREDAHGSFTTFEECYNQKIHNQPNIYETNEQTEAAYKDFSQPETIGLIRHFEQNYMCSGICDVPLFYLTRSLDQGPPDTDCVDAVIDQFLFQNYLVAGIAGFGAWAFTVAALATIPSCCGGDKQEKQRLRGKHVELSEDTKAMYTR